jgi:proliferating cell nuclear antigen
MLVKLENPGLLSKAIELISELVTEVRIKINEFGMSISAMDPANVAMVGFKIPRSAFLEFETDEETLGVNLIDLKRILKRCGTGGSIIIKKNENVLEIDILDRIKRSFKLALVEVDAEDINFDEKVAKMEFVSKIKINSVDLVDSIDDGLVVSDACSLAVEQGKFVMEARGMNSTRAEFSGDEVEITGEDCHSKYSLEYLQKFSKGVKICDRVELSLSTDHPLKLDIKADSVELSFVLAPRVETED